MDSILDTFQNFYDKFPFSMGTMLVFMGICALSFLVAFREFWAWYSKVAHMKRELHEMRESLLRIEKTLEKMQFSTPEVSQPNLQSLAPHEEKNNFPLVH